MSVTVAGFNDTQSRILHVIQNRDGPVVSSTIKDRVDTVTRSAVDAQLAALVDRGVIEAVDERRQGGGIPAKVYALTETGEREVQQHDITPTPPDEGPDRGPSGDEDVAAVVSSLNEQIEAAREKLIEAHARIDELEAVVDAHAETLDDRGARLDAHDARVSELADELGTAKKKLKQRTADLDRRVSDLESE